jgi:hypothetical protein
LGKPYRSQELTILIWDKDRSAFGDIQGQYSGHQVCSHGVISSCRGKPEMVLRSPEALQVK